MRTCTHKTAWLASTAALALMLAFGTNPAAQAQIRPPFGADTGQGTGAQGPSPTATAPAAQQPPAGFYGGPTASEGGGDFVGQTEQDLNAMAAGQFPEMDRSSTLPIGAIQNSWNKPMASSGQTSPGVMRYVWRPDFVMPIRTREFMTTTIELPNWEKVDRLVLGDTMVFEASRVKPNIIVLRPSHSGADTNMTVIGVSGNLYNFYLRSEGWNSTKITDLAVYVAAAKPNLANAIMPGASGMGAGKKTDGDLGSAEDMPDYLREIAYDPANLQFNMRIFAKSPSDIDIAPLRVFSDGIWTYFDYGSKADTQRRPVIFQVIDGVETMVNTRTVGPKGNIMVAEAVGDFVLRNGRRVICVYRAEGPRSFEAGGSEDFTGPMGMQQLPLEDGGTDAAVSATAAQAVAPDTETDADTDTVGRSDAGVPPQLELADKYKAYSGKAPAAAPAFAGAFQATER
jgi:ComB9 competence protein